MDGDAEGLDDGSFDAVTVGLNDGVDDFSTHSRFASLSSVFFSNQQHLAIWQIPDFLEFFIHSEMKSLQDTL